MLLLSPAAMPFMATCSSFCATPAWTRGIYSTIPGALQQNQFGGVIAGPIKKDKVFFFADYQGTRTMDGITSTETSVPSLQDRAGNLSDLASTLTGNGERSL